MGKTETVSWSVAMVLVVAMVCGSVAYGCTTSNRQYYDALSECVKAGGSAVPSSTGGAGSSIVCIRK